MHILWLLFIEFFKTGLFSIGGGLATLPFLFQMSERYGWFTTEQLTNMIAVSESTPGPIGINIATYVGFTTENLGVFGAIFTTLSLVLPSIIVILIIAGFLEKFKENKYVKNAFYGHQSSGCRTACIFVPCRHKDYFFGAWSKKNTSNGRFSQSSNVCSNFVFGS